MKTIVILNALPINNWALEPIEDAYSSLELVVKKFSRLEQVSEVVILVAEDTVCPALEHTKIVRLNEYSSKTVFSSIATCTHDLGADTVLFAYADAPLVDVSLVCSLLETHSEYKSEYTFAEGYPAGLGCEVVASGLFSILAHVSSAKDIRYSRECIFDVLKQNINSYDIEVVVAPENVQELRLEFFAHTKRNYALCKNFLDITAENYSKLIMERQDALFGVPAFYALELCSQPSVYKCYLPQALQKQPEKTYMSVDHAKMIVDRITEYSCDGVISLSIFGEPFLHPDIIEIITYCAQKKHFSLMLETAGLDLNRELIEKIHRVWEHSEARKSGCVLSWVICLDANNPQTYSGISNLTESEATKALDKAKECTILLNEFFDGDVYPQFIRMNENECDLEPFYRFWKEKLNKALIQKYDSLSMLLPNRCVADLSPLTRNPCWHLKRDLYILPSGEVCACRSKVASKMVSGNILTEDLHTIRNRIFPLYCEHVGKTYSSQCENCDEYYTFNF